MTPFGAPRCGRLTAGAAATICLIAAVVAPVASASARRVRIGQPPVLPTGVTPVAGTASVPTMLVTVALKPRHAAALAGYADNVSNPESVDFHRYLTTAEFRQRFAPSHATVRRVRAALRARGLPGGRLTGNGLALDLRTNSARVEHGFSVTLARVRTRTGTDVVYSVQAPAVNASIAGAVRAVIGLDGFSHEHADLVRHDLEGQGRTATAAELTADAASARVRTGGPEACSAARSAESATIADGYLSYTADQAAAAYSFSGLYASRDFGSGVTVALYELEPNLTSDIAAYQKCYGTHASVSYVKVDGGAQADPDAGGPAGEGEAALDIEQVIGLAPNAKILVYQGPNDDFDGPGAGPYDIYARMISENRASVISTSWGGCEADIGATAAEAENELFEEAAVQGQTVVAAGGDQGSEDCYYPGEQYDRNLAVDDPASQPFVTGAGGTSLTAIGPAPTESVWNDGASGGGGGGGLSLIWSMPAYQSAAAGSLGVIRSGQSTLEGCGPTSLVPAHPYCREVPDVSADADEDTGYLVYYNGTRVNAGVAGWQAIGGTSAAAPLWGALFALADSGCRSGRIGLANGRLYTLAGESQSTYFNDVTSGNNDVLGVQGDDFIAQAGYDMASGLGTPIASRLAPALCRTGITLTNPGARRTLVGTRVRLQLHATRGAGVTGTLRYGARHLPAGLTLNPSTGLISGTAKTAGISKVTVDAYAGHEIYGVASFTWTVAARPTASAVLTGAAGGRPTLRLTVAAGVDAAGLRTLELTLPDGVVARAGVRARVQALSSSGKSLGRTVSVHGRVVSVHLDNAQPKLRLVLRRGTLAADASIRSDATRADPRSVPLSLTVVDATGVRTVLRLSLRPS